MDKNKGKLNTMKYSVIVPVYNGERHIDKCITNLLAQKSLEYELEILIIDDCSVDSTSSIIAQYTNKYKEVIALSTTTNSGPGIARNIGIEFATGDYLMFVDSDDTLSKNALLKIDTFIKEQEDKLDIISYDFVYNEQSDIKVSKVGRDDFISLEKNKKELIDDYLSLHMDGSVIYTLISKDLINKNNIKFHKGIHEDVDFLFKIYLNTNKRAILNFPLYIKNNRKNSIVNTISEEHLSGFFRAYKEMFDYMQDINFLSYERLTAYYIGLVGLCATRVREIYTKKPKNAKELYQRLYEEFMQARAKISNEFREPKLSTKYFMIFNTLRQAVKNNEKDIVEYINQSLAEILPKSWSCYDLHHSLFLAPDEIRTCCKRFFVDNQLKGDVAIVTKDKYSYQDFNIENILKEKQHLYSDINKGVSDECSGCPFLEFKEWPSLDKLDIQYLSFEYHSICNMKCTYCSETYYDGKKSKYDVSKVVEELIAKKFISNCNSIVWGGGEPTLDKNFSPLIKKIADSFESVKQRVITNATVYIEDLKKYIDADKVSIVTSIDAGNKKTFQAIRKNKEFEEVISNLVKYSQNKPENITIKYIIMDENKDIEEIKEFVHVIKDNNLEKCNFQISFDFKKEHVDFESLVAIIILYGMLIKLNVRLVFFDDLLRTRLEDVTQDMERISQKLEELGYNDILADQNKLKNIVIWGAGNQTKNLLTTTTFFKNANIAYLVDNTPPKIGTVFMGYQVYDPAKLKENDFPILISAVQASPKILVEFKKLGLDESRIIKSLII